MVGWGRPENMLPTPNDVFEMTYKKVSNLICKDKGLIMSLSVYCAKRFFGPENCLVSYKLLEDYLIRNFIFNNCIVTLLARIWRSDRV